MAQVDVIARVPQKRQFGARFAQSAADLERVQTLRALVFRGGIAPDTDAFDALCRHVLVEDTSGALVCALRLLEMGNGAAITRSYAAQHYDLAALADYPAPMIEMGRFCIDPAHSDPAILRVAWAFVAEQVQRSGAEMLFGCSSFAGTSAQDYGDTFALLHARHLGPNHLRPGIKAPQVIRFASESQEPDMVAAMRNMPPLLRSYLMMGGWVSDHAVIDRDLGTLHVFTALEIAAIPPARRRFLQGAGLAAPVSG